MGMKMAAALTAMCADDIRMAGLRSDTLVGRIPG
jgi:hypothetical protein